MANVKKRVIVYVDGFNLYHAIDALPEGAYLKWLSVHALANEFIKSHSEEVVTVKYFTARAAHIGKNGFQARQKAYLDALHATNVEIVLGKFKKKHSYCKKCDTQTVRHEEKETDVNIATHLLADAYEDKFDVAYIISGDTDLLPPLRLLRDKLPSKEVVIVGPPNRGLANELREVATRAQTLKQGQLTRNRLPEEIALTNGKTITSPEEYTKRVKDKM